MKIVFVMAVFVVVIVGALLLLMSPTDSIVWGGVEIRKPVSKADFYNESGLLLAVSKYSSQPVPAGVSGKITKLTDRSLELSSGPVKLEYRGLMTDSSTKDNPFLGLGQEVKAGQPIGFLELGKPDPRIGELRMQLLYNDLPLPPPASFKPRYNSYGQQVYILACTGCHRLQAVVALSGGKMSNGQPATEQRIADAIPRFVNGLTPGQIKEVSEYLCSEVCLKGDNQH